MNCNIDIEDIYINKKLDIIIDEFKNYKFNYKSDYNKFRYYIQNKYKIIVSKSDLIKIYNYLNINDIPLKNFITKKKNKSNSGVLVITVLTSANPEYIDDNNNLIINKDNQIILISIPLTRKDSLLLTHLDNILRINKDSFLTINKDR